MSSTKNDIRGCIDIGSSYIRLLVAGGDFNDAPGSVSAIGEERRYIGWGRELEETGSVSAEAVGRAVAIMEELVEISGRFGCSRPYIVGCNILRSAGNSAEILTLLSAAAGISVNVLTAEGEGAMSLAGASSLYPPEERIILADPGGTSTEVVAGIGGKVESFTSVRAGTHTVLRIMERSGRGRGMRWSPGMVERFLSPRIRTLFRGLPESLLHWGEVSHLPAGAESPTIVFTGGSAVSLAVVSGFMAGERERLREKTGINSQDLELMVRRLCALFAAGRERTLPLADERLRLLIAGLALLKVLADRLGAHDFDVVSRDLRWGIVFTGGRLPEGYFVDE